MSLRKVLLAQVGVSLAGGCVALAAAEPPPAPTEPAKLTACAFVTVVPVRGAPKATLDMAAMAAQKDLPAARFEKLTVITDGTLTEAMKKALDDKAQVFLHFSVGEPKKIETVERAFGGPPGPPGPGGWGGRGRWGRNLDTIRSSVGTILYVADRGAWRKMKTLALSSAEAPPAETHFPDREGDFTEAWLRGVRLTAKVACERVLTEYFLRGAGLRAIKGSGAADPPSGAEGREPTRATTVKVELVNRSHCRILNATVTAEEYNRRLERWDAVGDPFGIRAIFQRGAGNPDPGRSVTWTFSEPVDPGKSATSDEQSVAREVLQSMTTRQCRLVLHATPAVTALVQPASLHPLAADTAPGPQR